MNTFFLSYLTLQEIETCFIFLLFKGGRIDQAHHDGRAKAAFEELLEFEKAVIYASTKTNEQDTLIIVTADHSHTMTINGYPERGNSIFGIFLDCSFPHTIVYFLTLKQQFLNNIFM